MSFARNVHFTVKKGKVDEFQRLMHHEVLPLLNDQRGFLQDITLLGGNSGMSISVWDDRVSAETYDKATYPQVLEKLGAVLDGTPRVDTYDTMFTLIH